MSELRRRARNGFRDYQLYSLERPARLSRRGAREFARNLARSAGASTLLGERLHFDYAGFRIPCDLAEMTGSGHAQWEAVIAEHLECYRRFMSIERQSRLLEVGCGIGRDAMALIDTIAPPGAYVGIDIVEPSIAWCRDEITSRHPHFRFFHLDVQSDMYNPTGSVAADRVAFPVESASIDRVVLHSVFTHMFADEVDRYLREIALCLEPGGRALASFFIVDDGWTGDVAGPLTFQHLHRGAARVNDPEHPQAAVAFSLEQIEAMAARANLSLASVHRGRWRGDAADAPNGQDLVVLAKS